MFPLEWTTGFRRSPDRPRHASLSARLGYASPRRQGWPARLPGKGDRRAGTQPQPYFNLDYLTRMSVPLGFS